jgi:hypothetical protein
MFYNIDRMDLSIIAPPILNLSKTTINSNITELEKISIIDPTKSDLISKYKGVLTHIDTISSSLSSYTVETFSSTITDLNNKIGAIDDLKVKYMANFTPKKEVNIGSIFADTITEVKNNIIGITTIFGMFFGSIVASHWCLINGTVPSSILYVLFYGFYGALLYPPVVLYGLLFPPMWRAPLIPLFKKDENSPSWIQFPGINLFTYVQPTVDDLPVGKGILRVMCGAVVALICTSVYLKINPNA